MFVELAKAGMAKGECMAGREYLDTRSERKDMRFVGHSKKSRFERSFKCER